MASHFGSLPGTEGGEFVIELPTETEYLSGDSKQLVGTALELNKKIGEKVEGFRAPTQPADRPSSP